MCVFVYGKNWNLMFWIDFEKPFFFLFSFFDQIEILNIQRDSTNASNDLNVGKLKKWFTIQDYTEFCPDPFGAIDKFLASKYGRFNIQNK